MIIHKIQQFGKKLLRAESSVKKLSLSTSVGIFIAFSPFVGFHTIMTIGLCWMLSLNFPVTLGVSCLINNPWTMLPVYGCDYGFGVLLSNLCNIDFITYMPQTLTHLFEPLCSYVGFPVHFLWTFFIGGSILSLLLAVMLYIPCKCLFDHLAQRKQNTVNES